MAARTRFAAGVTALVLLGLVVSLGLTACSTGNGDSHDAETAVSSADPDAFPVTIEHAFGSTTIKSEPTRVATLGWSDQDAAIALGVAPVGATKLTWGGNDHGSSDWFDAELANIDAEQPERYDDSDGAPIEEIAQLEPDVILASNSGITKKEYTKLSKIAPVVPYPDAPWTTSWQTSLDMVGKALGRNDQGAQILDETESAIADAKEEYPQIVDKTLVFGYLTAADMSTIGIYGPEDPRLSLMHDLGMKDAPIVNKVVDDDEFYGTISAERASSVNSDVFLTWSEKPDDMKKFSDNTLLGSIPAIDRGHAYAEEDKAVALAVTNPTPLSIPYVVEHFVPQVAKVAEGS